MAGVLLVDLHVRRARVCVPARGSKKPRRSARYASMDARISGGSRAFHRRIRMPTSTSDRRSTPSHHRSTPRRRSIAAADACSRCGHGSAERPMTDDHDGRPTDSGAPAVCDGNGEHVEVATAAGWSTRDAGASGKLPCRADHAIACRARRIVAPAELPTGLQRYPTARRPANRWLALLRPGHCRSRRSIRWPVSTGTTSDSG